MFVSDFLPNFPPSFPRIFRIFFVLCFPGNGDQNLNTKSPGKHEKNIHKMFLESRQSKKRVQTNPSRKSSKTYTTKIPDTSLQTGGPKLLLRVCRPAREPKTGKPPKVLPRALSVRPQNPRTTPTKLTINIASAKQGVVRILPFSWVPTIRTPPPQNYHPMRRVFCGDGGWLVAPYLRSTFGGFPVLGSLAGLQTLKASSVA